MMNNRKKIIAGIIFVVVVTAAAVGLGIYIDGLNDVAVGCIDGRNSLAAATAAPPASTIPTESCVGDAISIPAPAVITEEIQNDISVPCTPEYDGGRQTACVPIKE